MRLRGAANSMVEYRILTSTNTGLKLGADAASEALQPDAPEVQSRPPTARKGRKTRAQRAQRFLSTTGIQTMHEFMPRLHGVQKRRTTTSTRERGGQNFKASRISVVDAFGSRNGAPIVDLLGSKHHCHRVP